MWAAEAKLRKDISFEKEEMISKGTIVTITRGLNCKYALWGRKYIYDIKSKYIDKSTIKIISEK
jgi:hypothetical protein